jgi:hypothetical protein
VPNSLIKPGRQAVLGQQKYTQEELDYFLQNYSTFTESNNIENSYGVDMKALSLLSTNAAADTLFFNGNPV